MTKRPRPPGHDGKCGADKRHGGSCTQPAGWGTTHPGIGRCKLHGGSTPNHRRSAQVEIARRACDRLGVPIPVDEADPGAILLGLVREAAGNVEFYRALVAELPTHPTPGSFEEGQYRQGDPGVYAPTYHQSGIPTGEGKPHVLVAMYNDERDRLARYVKEALAAGIEERRVRLEEADAQTLMEGFAKGVQAAKLTPQQAEVMRRAFADHLRQSRAAGIAG